ncbi:hypothetical protein OK015_28825 (plasmid) [Mycobacterium sp. Aquia_216]|uniref:hypothetical protein n=1 Tax=Mycobacterium sp. Aquia_216 TaxID=2991729 RepID=UPI00227D3EB4|nr:hypothetical protein [Mycobacterium sp. Aquia_216]WAJ47958.1 hypothetical protein OK015_28825 [Mycobacterium sp. Aquia_216]
MTDDPGRVAVYCDNSDCDAREFEVVIVDDGTAATRNRTDVRILAHFPPQFVDPLWAGPGEDWAAGTPPFARTRGGLVDCMFCGERSCRLSQGDIAHDDGRIRLCCSNNHCQVGEVEVLVMRDEVRSLGEERPDVKALNALFVSRADRLAAELPPGAPRIFAFADFAAPADGVDPLAMRISGPVPWDGG